MADPYLAIAEIANNEFMKERLNAATIQQWHLGNIQLGIDGNNSYNVLQWVNSNRYLWASSPSWGEKWASALVSHGADPNYDPGKDESVITDADILAVVQSLTSE